MFARHGIPIPDGVAARTPDEATGLADSLGYPVVVKAQVLTGGRGKAGGVKIVANPDELRAAATKLLAMRIKDLPVTCVLLSRVTEIRAEYYLSLTVDRTAKAIRCMLSDAGGMDIEDIATQHPERIHSVFIHPLDGIDEDALHAATMTVFASETLAARAEEIIRAVHRVLLATHASLVEINPLALDASGGLIALDAKMVLDDNGVATRPELDALRNAEEYSQDEMEARKAGLSFVGLTGTIGCMVNGAGLAMATMDMIKLLGHEPANFLDVGGSSSPEKVLAALRILLHNPRLKAILVNIFGGITRCDDIARGLLMARRQLDVPVPLVVRLIGTDEEEGRKLLHDAGIAASTDMMDALRQAVHLSEGS